MKYEAVVIGVSCGGLAALSEILSHLAADFPLPIIVAQHLHPTQDTYFFDYLNRQCALTVKDAEDKEEIRPGFIYFAPPNYHLLVEKDRTFALSVDERVNYSRPSIDVLFESAVDVFAGRLIGLILTGANNDGAQGLRLIKEHQGVAIVQDPVTAEVDYMPRAAISASEVDYILPLGGIAPCLRRLARDQGA